MENRLSHLREESWEKQNSHRENPRPIGEILLELFAQYQTRFPEIGITVVETPVNAL
jgi:hypothetical protein